MELIGQIDEIAIRGNELFSNQTRHGLNESTQSVSCEQQGSQRMRLLAIAKVYNKDRTSMLVGINDFISSAINAWDE
jgi:hypothetical protein